MIMSKELLESQNTVSENTDVTYSELKSSEEMENSPFMLTSTENGSIITLGQYRLTPFFETKQKAKDYLNSHMWEVIYKMVFIINEHLNKKGNE